MQFVHNQASGRMFLIDLHEEKLRKTFFRIVFEMLFWQKPLYTFSFFIICF